MSTVRFDSGVEGLLPELSGFMDPVDNGTEGITEGAVCGFWRGGLLGVTEPTS